jgi:superoxide dismutase
VHAGRPLVISKKYSELANVARALCSANIAPYNATLKWFDMPRSSKQPSRGRLQRIRIGAIEAFFGAFASLATWLARDKCGDCTNGWDWLANASRSVE